ncbi:MAG: DegT/DnrJ/EryC1/StrS family aminotransferase [Candidatus Aminicenantes bacterium]|nr:MAG: DegT/DnrJ/EryC1/StrS family aminotransferase [Candidatus Aminicenantes bacterium]
MDIPFLDLKAQYKSIQKEIDQKILEVISSQKFILGAEVENFEKEIAAYSGAKYAVGVSSGSDALISSLMALEIKQGDAVVTTPFTFFATAGAISRLGARIVFCDIDRVTYNINPDNLEMLFKKGNHRHGDLRIKAIIPVHLYGQCADMTPILALAERYDLLVIEDAAQALGAEYPFPDGVKKASTIGDLGILSFFPSKNLGGYGDGGMVLTHKEDLALKLKLLRGHGSKNKYFNEIVGGNFRLDALQAAVLRIKLKYLDKWQQKRRENASYYNKLFKESGLVGENFIQLPEAVYRDSGVQDYHTYHQYVVRAKDRDDLKAFLKEKGVATAIYYPLPLHLQKCFADLGYRGGDFPESEKAASEVLALPIYPELTANQQEFLVTCIKKFYQRK